jgi:hypothetical protein
MKRQLTIDGQRYLQMDMRYFKVSFEENGGEYGTSVVVHASRVRRLSQQRLEVDGAIIHFGPSNRLGTVRRASKKEIWWDE